MNWRDEVRGPNADELRRRAAESVPLLTPDDRQKIRAARDADVRERELTLQPNGKWKLPPSGGSRK